MVDQKYKVELIQRIEQLQLPRHLIVALEDAQHATPVIEAVESLTALSQQWY